MSNDTMRQAIDKALEENNLLEAEYDEIIGFEKGFKAGYQAASTRNNTPPEGYDT